jgi:predicted DNA-binding transcriptional regulator AlpA
VIFGHATLWRNIRLNLLPKPIKLSGRATAWCRAAIIDWPAARESKNEAKEAKNAKRRAAAGSGS